MKTRFHALGVGVNFTQKIVSSVRNVRNNNKTHFVYYQKNLQYSNKFLGLTTKQKKLSKKSW